MEVLHSFKVEDVQCKKRYLGMQNKQVTQVITL